MSPMAIVGKFTNNIVCIAFVFTLFCSCRICVSCVQSSGQVQPPCGLCRKCGQYNAVIFLPPNYVIGRTSVHGLELSRSANLFHHLDERLMARRPAPTNLVHPMLNIGAQNKDLPFK